MLSSRYASVQGGQLKIYLATGLTRTKRFRSSYSTEGDSLGGNNRLTEYAIASTAGRPSVRRTSMYLSLYVGALLVSDADRESQTSAIDLSPKASYPFESSCWAEQSL
jgi:hypothetical protein